jgi:tetratricopeptide (TPR) repeat protein
MPISLRACVGLLAVFADGTAVSAQVPPGTGEVAPLVPLHALSKQDLDHREAVKLYGLALLSQREDRLLETVRLLEEARRLDPQAAVLPRALIPLYLALCRTDDALTAGRQVLDLDPGDFETRYLLARQLKEQGRPRDALATLAPAAASPGLKERPDVGVQIFFDLGSLYEDAKQYEKAVVAYREVIKVLEKPEALMELGPFQPDLLTKEAARTYEKIGRVHVQAKQYDRAVAAFRQAQAKNPDQAGRLNYNLAEVCLALGKPPEALDYLEEYLKTQPQGVDAYELKIALLKRLNRDAEALPALVRHALNDRHNVALQLLLARQYALQGEVDEASRIYLKTAAESPAHAVESYRGLFTAYKNSSRMGEALNLLDEALTRTGDKEKNPTEAAAAAPRARAMIAVLREAPDLVRALLPELRARLHGGNRLKQETRYILAMLAARTHQLDDAERLYRSCLAEARANPDLETSVYSGLLQVLWEGRKYAEVVEVCRQGLRQTRATNRVLFHTELAKALVMVGKAGEALTEADAAVNLTDVDNRLFCKLLRVRLLGQVERTEQAVAECQALFKEFPQPEELRKIRYTLSNVYSGAKDLPKAEEQLLLLLQQDPNDVTANNDLGYIWADQGKNLEEAERMIRKAIDLDREQKKGGAGVGQDPENAAYLDSLGWVLFRRGRLDDALLWMEKAAGMSDGADDPVVWDHLGDVCFRRNEVDRARAAWEKAVHLYESEQRRKPDDRFQEIRHKIELLKREGRP